MVILILQERSKPMDRMARPDQVLMKNSAVTWGSLSEFKFFKQFDFTFPNATQSFTIPTGVTKIAVEVWSGGGGGSIAGGVVRAVMLTV